MKKLFTLFVAMLICIGTTFAEQVIIGDFLYNLDAATSTAELVGLHKGVISVKDQTISEWNALPSEYVFESVCPSGALWDGLKKIRVYADDEYINFIVVYDPSKYVKHRDVDVMHIFMDADNDSNTGGYFDLYADADADLMFEGSLFDAQGVAINYNPAVSEWSGEVNGEGWEWTIISSVNAESQFIGDSIIEGRLKKSSIPWSNWKDQFGIGFALSQNFDASKVGFLPQGNSPDGERIGRSNMLDVTFAPAPSPLSGSITIPSSVVYNGAKYNVTSIGNYAFYSCKSLSSVSIPNSVTSIGEWAFYGCSGLTTPVYNARVFAFLPTSYSGEYIIPNGIESIVAGAFCDCNRLTAATIPNSVTSVGYDAFANCSSLKSLVFPSSLVYLEEGVFDGCTGLEIVKIPSTVLSYGEYNRQQCEKGEQIYECEERYFGCRYTIAGDVNYDYYEGWRLHTANLLPNLKTVEAPAWFFDVPEVSWASCPKYLEKVVVNQGELNDNVLGVIKRSYKTLLSLNVASVSNTSLADEAFKDNYNLQELVLPAGLTSVSYMAVAGCKNLKAIDIPASVEIIDQSAFEDCRSIESITFGGKQPASVSGRKAAKAADSKLRKIGNWAFYNAHQLQHLEIPEGVEEIGDGAFYGCTYLQDLSLPSSVRSIGDNCFALCSKLKMITVNSTTPPQIRPRTFYDVSRQIPVYVPEDVVADYKNDDLWGQMNIQGMETAVENISANNPRHTKLLIDGKLFILRGDKIYTVQGQEVR